MQEMQETRVHSSGSGRSPGGVIATHSSILAWTIPWTEDPGGLQSWGRKELDTTEQLTHTHGKSSKSSLLLLVATIHSVITAILT